MDKPNKPLVLCGRVFLPELVEHLNLLVKENPSLSKTAQARELCEHLGWFSPNGKAATSSAKVALNKLHRRGLLAWPASVNRVKRTRQLRRSDQPLPALSKVPEKAGRVQGLQLHLLSGHDDPLNGVWNDLIIDQHPCGAAPLVGAQLRYLVGSDHGWLGALGFGPAAFVLGARDLWIGWSAAARMRHLNQVVGLSRFLIRLEVRCANLASKVLSLALGRLPDDWRARYALTPLLVETFVDRERFTGCCFSAANWQRLGSSSGRGRLGPTTAAKSLKDIWVYPLSSTARSELQKETPPPVTPRPIVQFLAQEEWCALELEGLELGDRRLHGRAEQILRARWEQPQASFHGSFEGWTPAKAAYGFIEHRHAPLSLETLLEPHHYATMARMAAEPLVLLPQDTTTFNFSGLLQTCGLGPVGDAKTRGLWMHSLLAYRPDGVPLGVLQARCWARPEAEDALGRGRNAKGLDEKESVRWVETLHAGAAAARRMPQTQVVVMTDREGDLYEMHEAVQYGPANLHTLIRAQHDRNLEGHQKLWAFMAALPAMDTRTIALPRRHGQSARHAILEVRWSPVALPAPQTGCKKSWPPLQMWALWVHEPHPPEGVESLDWMLLSDLPIADAQQAWQRVEWYRCRWGIEEWHRVLKTGCCAEQREFKTAEHLQRVLAFDLIVGWRVLACVKLGRALPQLPARALYTREELDVLWAHVKKKPGPSGDHLSRSQSAHGPPGRLHGPASRRRTRRRERGDRPTPTYGPDARLAPAETTS